MAINIRTGGKKAVEISGIKELEAKLADVVDRSVGEQAIGVVRDAAGILYNQALSNAKSVNVPHEVEQDIFLYGQQNDKALARNGVSALVGLRKRGANKSAKGYVEWTPKNRVGKFEKTQRSKPKGGSLVLPGTQSAKGGGLQKIGENLGTMWELGTTQMEAKPWFRPAVTQSRGAVLGKLADGYSKIIASKTKTG